LLFASHIGHSVSRKEEKKASNVVFEKEMNATVASLLFILEIGVPSDDAIVV
jgi:hypothetical protein